MRISRFTASVAFSGLICVVSGGSVAAAAPPAVPISGASLVALAGSHHWLVYTTSGTSEVWQRNTAGRLTKLSKNRAADTGWSMASNVLSAARPYVPYPAPTKVDWWNLGTGTHGTVTLNKNASYVAAAPSGFFVVSASGDLDLRKPSTGSVTSYGPIAKHFVKGVAGPKGLLINQSHGATYVSYARPRKPITLQVPGGRGQPSDCSAVDRKAAVCYRFNDGDDDRTPVSDVLAPINGAKPTISTTCPGVPTVVGTTMIWSEGAQPTGSVATCSSPGGTLDSIVAGATAVDTSSTQVSVQRDGVGRLVPSAVNAYTGATFVSSDGQSFIEAYSATNIQPL